ncbi:alpha-N-acetyl-neuraminyl-2,3-beta-galactosyl-1,3-N-acetyl-galactosaminide alpha-2,6-sialyltransferase [Ambystoma mexicanum]|uniref:alpha-N-acetyl-neuraminyl-2,3-beta-galactosyl-1, 3-N-acetyl-galactosaminide alpha-2,6-sialyltransferase n=1 Tax=Ambystoma mexicanum TaxID=8296 RepID=UPI0037E8AE3B
MKIIIRLCVVCLLLGACSLLFHLCCSSFCWTLCWAQCEASPESPVHVSPASPLLHLPGYTRVSDGQVLSRPRCQRCSVVSSSGQMLGSRKGQEIDSAECVLRMNQAPTQGFEEDVGSRSTVRVVSHTSVPLLVRNSSYFFQQSSDTMYIIWGPQKVLNPEKGVVYRTLLKVQEMYPKTQVYTLTEAMMAHCDLIFKNETGKDRMKSGSFLSTGWFTMILAMEMCENISVYGMVSESYCREKNQPSVPYHYFEKGKMTECSMYLVHERALRGGHRFITEKAVFSRWAKKKHIVFTHPSWKND